MGLNSANKVDTNTYELEITVGPEDFEKAVAAAFRKNSKKLSVPGFRRGKAPRHIVEKLYGEGIFYEEAMNDLYPQAYSDAVEEAKIEPVDRADVEIVKVSKEDGFTFKAKVTVKPEVTVGDYKGLAVTKKVETASEEEIGAEIDRMRDRNARIITVEDRAAQNGDNTVIDFEGFIDGVAFDGGKGEKFPLTLGSGQFIPGFEDQIVGHNTGDEFEVKVTFPEDYPAENLKDKEAVFKVKLHEIKNRELPDADDEFAKDVSEFDTLDALKADIAKRLNEAKEKAANDAVENSLVDQIIAGMQAEIPACMFEHRIDEMVQEFEYRLQAQGMNLDTYLQYTGMERDSFRKTFRDQAERQVKIRLALEKIVELEGIVPSAEELEEEYKKLAENYNIEVDKVKTFIPEKDIAQDLAVNKAIDMIRDSAKVTESAASDEEKKAPAKKRAPRKTAAKKKTEEAAE